MYDKAAFCLCRTDVSKISFVACEFSPFKIHYSDKPKSFNNKINEV